MRIFRSHCWPPPDSSHPPVYERLGLVEVLLLVAQSCVVHVDTDQSPRAVVHHLVILLSKDISSSLIGPELHSGEIFSWCCYASSLMP